MFSFVLIGYGDFEHADQHLQIYAHLQMVIRASPLYLPSTHTPSIFCLSCLSFVYLCRTHREDEETAVRTHSQVWICPLWCFEPAALRLLCHWFRKVRMGLISSLPQRCCEDVNPEWVMGGLGWVNHSIQGAIVACQQAKVFDFFLNTLFSESRFKVLVEQWL